MKITIYTKSGCSYCKKAKTWFKEQGIDYDLRIINNPVKRERFYKDCGPNVNTMPQIFLDDTRIGGYNDLIKNASTILSEFGGLMTQSKTYKPFLYPWAVDLTVESELMHWVEQELDLSEDVTQWKKGTVTDNEKEFITHVLRLFTQGDVAVAQNYYDYYIPKMKNNEVRNMLGSIAAREGIHQRAYALLNDTLGLPDSEYHAFLGYKEMTDKIDWIQDNDIHSFNGIGLSIAKTVFSEGVSLFASFAMLLNFQRFGKMKGMGKVVEWSIKDEALIEDTLVVLEDGETKVIQDITKNDKILQFDMTSKELSYVNPTKTQHVTRNESITFIHPEFNQTVSPNHRMIYEEDGEIKECLAKDFIPSDTKYFLSVE